MANTLIQIKRSTTTDVPASLEAGELAFTSNGDTLWIGSPSGANTANVVNIGAKISKTANSSQIGDTAGGSNTELASTWAIKTYVDGKFGAVTSSLAGLTDVGLSSTANNDILVYDAASGDWENHTISGTSNEVEVTFSGQNITVGLPSAVTITTSLGVGSNVNLTTSGISVGNATVNTQITSSGITANGANITSVNAATVGGNTASDLRGYSDTVAGTAYSNAIAIADGYADTAYSNAISIAAGYADTAYSNAVSVAASDATTKAGTAYSNAVAFAANADNISSGTLATARLPATANVSTAVNIGANVNLTTSSISVGNSTVNTFINSTSIATGSLQVNSTYVVANNLQLGGVANLVSANVSGNVVVGGTLSAGNTTINGDLTVTGTLTTVDSTNLVVEDSLLRLARNQANTGTFTDAVDIGFYGVYGNTSSTKYTGLARDSSANVYVLFDGKSTSPDNNGVATTDTLSTLYAYLNSGALTTNSTAVALTANSTVAVSITANSLSLSTALTVPNGGTGKTSFTNNAVVFGYGTGVLQEATGSNGQVLQITANVPTFGGLDGGSF